MGQNGLLYHHNIGWVSVIISRYTDFQLGSQYGTGNPSGILFPHLI